MRLSFKKDPVAYKQPQEQYCSNFECLQTTAEHDPLAHLLDEYGERMSKHYCFDCIVDGKCI